MLMNLGSLLIVGLGALVAALILAGVAVAHVTISRWRRQVEEAEAWQQRYESLYEEQTERCRKLLAINTELRYQLRQAQRGRVNWVVWRGFSLN
jgi:uncharacterized protein HemX